MLISGTGEIRKIKINVLEFVQKDLIAIGDRFKSFMLCLLVNYY